MSRELSEEPPDLLLIEKVNLAPRKDSTHSIVGALLVEQWMYRFSVIAPDS
jgi:hypothetical protein